MYQLLQRKLLSKLRLHLFMIGTSIKLGMIGFSNWKMLSLSVMHPLPMNF